MFGPSTLEKIIESGELVIITRNNPTTYYEGPHGPTGLEYEMAKLFADELGVELKVIVASTVKELFSKLRKGDAQIAAAGLTITDDRMKDFHFSPAYQEITEQLIYNISHRRPKDITDLTDGTLEVVAHSSHSERLKYLKEIVPGLQWRENDKLESEELIELVSDEFIEYTIADSNEVLLNQRFYLNIRPAFDISTPQPLAWVMKKKGADNSLHLATIRFFERIKTDGTLDHLIERSYGHVEEFDYVGTILFKRHAASKLPEFTEFFKTAGDVFDIDWRLLAAMSYQESHWNPKARSHTGVRGLMMLTKATAEQMGVDRLSVEGSIRGGAKYLAEMIERIDEEVPAPDRVWMALASYNVGLYHLRDARKITEELGKDSKKWSDVKQSLPLLAKRKWYKKVKHGYARGWEPVQYVENIRSYYDILVWLDEGDIKTPDDPDVFNILPQVP